ncbi:hypothetical protein [Edaphocola aurantiacus]|uniref:hypothetical protein n=1 Tax=Edaphocola aurantiacus TaxID=2601682 RepID=UPI001C954CA0|nr:hypothetical protein [Edaphocola aurantiacus]
MQKIFLILCVLHFNQMALAQSNGSPVSICINITDEYINQYKKGTAPYELLRGHYSLDSLPSIEQKSYGVMIELTNTSDKPVYIASMTCGWPEIFMLNNKDYLHFDYEGCDGNVPETITIAPQQHHYFYAVLIEHLWHLQRPDDQNVRPKYTLSPTRIGLKLLYNPHDKGNKNYFAIMQDRDTWSVVWSNTLELYPEKP